MAGRRISRVAAVRKAAVPEASIATLLRKQNRPAVIIGAKFHGGGTTAVMVQFLRARSLARTSVRLLTQQQPKLKPYCRLSHPLRATRRRSCRASASVPLLIVAVQQQPTTSISALLEKPQNLRRLFYLSYMT